MDNIDEMLRRDFKLLATDEAGLASRGLEWEAVIDGGHRWLVLRNYSVPAGMNVSSTTIALDVPSTYPSAEIDMFYCAPHLARLDGQPIAQTEARMEVRGVPFQRWSRHRGTSAPWRPGIDSILTHLALVDAAILREVEP